MVKIVRTSTHPYRWTTGLHDLKEIANVENFIPRDWITPDGFMVTDKFIEYARPLIEGEVVVPTEGGLPKYAVLKKQRLDKFLPPRV
jgi:hypothetical protein